MGRPALVQQSPSTSTVVEFRDIRKIYGSGRSEVRALDGVDLTIHRGEFLSIMGASGSGKSTAMNIMGCLDSPTSGSYFFNGVDAATLDRDQLALLRRHYLGFVFQGFNLLARTTVLENVELPLIYRGTNAKDRRTRALEALEAVGLAGRESATPAQLSGGQQQRVAIARALVTNPSLLLADEPTGNLDSKRAFEIIELLVDLNRERAQTIVMITHEPDLAEHAKRIVVFRDGKIIDDRPASRGAR